MESNVDLNLLKTFIITCELQNLRLVGLRLGISESAVSKQLSRLAEQLGQPLFIRTSSGLKPTQFSLSIRPQLQESLKQISATLRKQAFHPSQYTQPVRVATFEHFLIKYGAPLFSALRDTFPLAKIEIETWSSKTTEKLINGQLDLGIHFFNEDRTADIWQKGLLDDMAVAVVGKQFAHHDWHEVIKWPALRPKSQGWNHLKFRYMDFLRERGVNIEIAATLDNFEAIHQILKNQPMCTVLNQSCVPDTLAVIAPPPELQYTFKIASHVHIVNRDAALQACLNKLVARVLQSNLNN